MDLSGTMQGAGGVGGLLAVTIPAGDSNAGIYYPTYDGNGSVSEYLDFTGSVEAHYDVGSFGNEISPTTAQGLKQAEFSHRFSTKPLDEEVGLYYYGYRYYGPATGRWPSRDPLGEEGGVDLYGFVGNDGVDRCDLLGLLSSRHIPHSGNSSNGIDWSAVGEGISNIANAIGAVIDVTGTALDLFDDFADGVPTLPPTPDAETNSIIGSGRTCAELLAACWECLSNEMARNVCKEESDACDAICRAAEDRGSGGSRLGQ